MFHGVFTVLSRCIGAVSGRAGAYRGATGSTVLAAPSASLVRACRAHKLPTTVKHMCLDRHSSAV
eukprot:7754179-Alexandrium_andersonii.AAC.1